MGIIPQIDYLELDYNGVYLNPMVVPQKKSPEDFYEDWKRYVEFLTPTPEVDRKKLFRYIPLAYGQKSPLHAAINNIKKVKGVAAELAGFQRQNDGQFLSSVNEILTCRNFDVNRMIVRYITLHKSAKYHEYCILREAHFNLGVKVTADPSPKDLSNFTSVGNRVDELSQDLLNKDSTESLQENLYEYYMEDRLRLRPEDIAKKRQELKKQKEEADAA